MRTRTLQRRTSLETVSVEPFSSRDGQGAPIYAASQDIEAAVRRDTEYIADGTGSGVKVTLTLHVPGDESPIPAEKDRLTYSGSRYIVEMVDEVRSPRNVVDHVKVKARDE